MEEPRVFMVHLRRPKSAAQDPHEMRSDPFWEFGSFGCTGCHRTNLLSVKNAPMLAGHRLALAQGGPAGFRLVFLTPPVSVRQVGSRFEILWTPCVMPFKYACAPVLVSNEGDSDLPLLKQMLRGVKRTTPEGAFSSCFRSRSLPLLGPLGDQLVSVYEQARATARPSDIAQCYAEALPYPPPVIDPDRHRTYQRKLAEMNQHAQAKPCGSGHGSAERSSLRGGCGTPRCC